MTSKCPRCGGKLIFEIGSHFTQRVRSEDRIVCINCARYRYLSEYDGHHGPKARHDGLPYWVVGLAPASR